MNILEYVSALDVELKIRFGSNQAGPWIANIVDKNGFSISGADGLDDCMDRGMTGWGKTPDLAIHDLCQSINTHKYLRRNNQLLRIPDKLTY